MTAYRSSPLRLTTAIIAKGLIGFLLATLLLLAVAYLTGPF